jgi:hypothetical protein
MVLSYSEILTVAVISRENKNCGEYLWGKFKGIEENSQQWENQKEESKIRTRWKGN